MLPYFKCKLVGERSPELGKIHSESPPASIVVYGIQHEISQGKAEPDISCYL